MTSQRREQLLLTSGEPPLSGFSAMLAGSDSRRFIVGSVAVPLLVAAMLVGVGAWVTASFQERSHRWQEERARVREVADGLRTGASELLLNLAQLRHAGGAIERTSANVRIQMPDYIAAVDESLSTIDGWATLREGMADSVKVSVSQAGDLHEMVEACNRSVNDYVECISKRGESRLFTGDEVCTERHMVSTECDDLIKVLRTVRY